MTHIDPSQYLTQTTSNSEDFDAKKYEIGRRLHMLVELYLQIMGESEEVVVQRIEETLN